MEKVKTILREKELMRKILFTFGILLLFRIGCAFPVPFIQNDVLNAIFTNGGLLGYLNMIGGGALEKNAVFALGVAPYINASIIIQLLCVAFPALGRAQKDDPKQIQKYTQWIALGLGVFMAVGYYLLLRNYNALLYTSGLQGFLTGTAIVFLFLAGSQIVVWLGWQIDDHGVGNGVSMLIFAGIVARWSDMFRIFSLMDLTYSARDWVRYAILILLPAAALLSVFYVVKANDTEACIPIVYSKSAHSRFEGGHKASYMPFKLMMSGVMPIIFAGTIVNVPSTIAMFIDAEKHPFANMLASFNQESWLYCIAYVALIFAFNYFYISIQFDPIQIANNLRNSGGAIPGIRPGKPTSDYLSKTSKEMAPLGAAILSLIAAAPIVIGNFTGLPIQLGGTSLIIVCGVATETVAAIDSYLTVRQHSSLLAN